MNKKIGIIDYGMGNIGSVRNSLNALNARSIVSSEANILADCDALILPGVGCFNQATKNIDRLNLRPFLEDQIITQKKPYLGICLGMQLLAETSEEKGLSKGFGWIKGHIKNFPSMEDLRVPHVGWNNTQFSNTTLFRGIKKNTHFYYDHSFHFVVENSDTDNSVASCKYGVEVTAAIEKGNIFATQFHPEKSQINGLRVIKNFLLYVEEGGQC